MSHPATDLLAGLTPDRAAHSRQVARTVAVLAPQWCHIDHVGDLVTAALLHDVGYHPDLAHTGFHPLDGAIYLAEHGYSPLTCHLVATHTAAHLEAEVRGIPAEAFTPFLLPFPTDQFASLVSKDPWIKAVQNEWVNKAKAAGVPTDEIVRALSF